MNITYNELKTFDFIGRDYLENYSNAFLGKLSEIYFNPLDWSLNRFEINTKSWLPDKYAVISPRKLLSVRPELREVFVNLDRKEITKAPAYEMSDYEDNVGGADRVSIEEGAQSVINLPLEQVQYYDVFPLDFSDTEKSEPISRLCLTNFELSLEVMKITKLITLPNRNGFFEPPFIEIPTVLVDEISYRDQEIRVLLLDEEVKKQIKSRKADQPFYSETLS